MLTAAPDAPAATFRDPPASAAAPVARASRRTVARALALVAVAALAALARLAHGGAARLLFTDGDTVTLPILLRGVGAPGWRPVLSTQLLAFPELPLYALCAALTPSTAWALVAAAVVNVAAFAAGIGLLARQTAPRAVVPAAVATAVAVVVLAGAHGSEAASGLLLTTYYDGVLLCAPVALAGTLAVLRAWREGRLRAARRLGAALGIVCAATVWSDGLYDLWVAVPLVGCLLLCVARRALSRLEAEVLAAVQLGAVAAGEAIRRIGFSHEVVRSELSYVHPGYARHVVGLLRTELGQAWSTPGGAVEVVAVGVFLTVAAVVAGRAARRRPGAPPDVMALLPAGFAVVAPVWSVAALLVVGAAPPRYLAPLVVFPTLAIPVAYRWRTPGAARYRWRTPGAARGHDRVLRRVVAAGVTVAVAASSLAALAGVDPGRMAGTSCLDAALGPAPAVGVAGYGVGRALDVYGPANHRVLQVDGSIHPYPWLVDLGAYQAVRVTFVVLDPRAQLDAGDVDAVAGPPAAVVRCPRFVVARYPAGSAGSAALTSRVAAGMAALAHPSGPQG